MPKCNECGNGTTVAVEQCLVCGTRVTSGGHGNGDAGARTAENGVSHRIVTDGGTDAGGLSAGAAAISLASVLYFVMNLLGALLAIGISSASSAVGAGGLAASSGIAAVVFVVLTVGFIAAPAGVIMNKPWGWTAMAGVWTLDLVWSLLNVVTGGSLDGLGMVFLLINLAVLGWIGAKKQDDLMVGQKKKARPA